MTDGLWIDADGSEGLSEADLAAIAARANAYSRRDILRLVRLVRRLEADLDRAVDRALEHRGGEAQARHQLAQATARAEAAEADARKLREDVGAAIRVLPGGTVSRPLAAQVADLAADLERLRDAMIDQHQASEHFLLEDCPQCAAALDEANPDLACDDYKRWQRVYKAALKLPTTQER